MGPRTRAFEEALRQYCRAREAVVMNNGTSALIAALLANGVGRGSEVLVPTFTFVATVNSVLAVGARPVFVDCDPTTLNVTVELIERARRAHPEAKALVFVDIAGVPADVDAIRAYADDHHLVIVEDAAEAFGAECRGTRLGSYDHATVFSFHMAKQISCVEGGGVLTNDTELAEKCRRIRSHGEGREKYVYAGFGLNFRPTDLQSAIGVAQLSRVDQFIAHRDRIARTYRETLPERLTFQDVPSYCTRSTHMLFASFLDSEAHRDALASALSKARIDTRRTFPPVHDMEFIRGMFGRVSLPNSEDVYRRVLALPTGNGVSVGQVKRVVSAVTEAVANW